MAITLKQIESLGFKATKKGGGLSKYKKFDTFIYPLNKTDYLYIGYNPFKREINNKTIWKSIMTDEGRLNYQVINIGETGFGELKDFINRCLGVRMTPPYEVDHLSKDDVKVEPVATIDEIVNTMRITTGTNINYGPTIITDVREHNS